jgi:hypothetical protein
LRFQRPKPLKQTGSLGLAEHRNGKLEIFFLQFGVGQRQLRITLPGRLQNLLASAVFCFNGDKGGTAAGKAASIFSSTPISIRPSARVLPDR